eukprot:scaffold2607_cov254-Pinguiococcus_pyrenoidosus.AAC.10
MHCRSSTRKRTKGMDGERPHSNLRHLSGPNSSRRIRGGRGATHLPSTSVCTCRRIFKRSEGPRWRKRRRRSSSRAAPSSPSCGATLGEHGCGSRLSCCYCCCSYGTTRVACRSTSAPRVGRTAAERNEAFLKRKELRRRQREKELEEERRKHETWKPSINHGPPEIRERLDSAVAHRLEQSGKTGDVFDRLSKIGTEQVAPTQSRVQAPSPNF